MKYILLLISLFATPLIAQDNAPFAKVSVIEENDVITGEGRIALALEADRHTMFIGCSLKRGGFYTFIVPDRYYGADPEGLFWRPNAIYRFDGEEAVKGKWEFNRSALAMGELSHTSAPIAVFLDKLSRGNLFYLRYQARQRDSDTTVVFRYSLNISDLKMVVNKCNHKKVIKELQKLSSTLVE